MLELHVDLIVDTVYTIRVNVFSGCNMSLEVAPQSRTHLTFSSSSVNCNYDITSTNSG